MKRTTASRKRQALVDWHSGGVLFYPYQQDCLKLSAEIYIIESISVSNSS
jgi:hypothetical protein